MPRTKTSDAPASLGFCILYTPDVAAKVAFYERAFGMARKMVTPDGSYGEMRGAIPLGFVVDSLAEKGVGAYTPARRDAAPLGCEIGFVVDDVARAFARAVDAGAIPHREPATKPWGQIVAVVRDCDGALVELCTAWSND